MRKIYIFIVLAVLCLNVKVLAQQIKPVQVGEQLGESFWKQVHLVDHHGEIKKSTLAKYRGTPLVLDFWATWCSTCLKKFKLLDSAANTLNINIVLINSRNTGDNHEKITKCLSNLNDGKIRLPTLVDDSLMQAYFPNRFLPHYVWIDSTGRVQAISGAFLLNWESLKTMAGEKIRRRNPAKTTLKTL